MDDAQWKTDMESRMRVVETNQAVNGARYEAIRTDIHDLGKQLEKVNDKFGRITWIVIAAIIGGFMTWVINGGLVIG